MNRLAARASSRSSIFHVLLLVLMITSMLIITACSNTTVKTLQDQHHNAEPVSADRTQSIQTTVVRVIDGDTVALAPVNGELASTDDDMSETSVRLLGIQAPEMNYQDPTAGPECMAQHATDRLEALLPVGTEVTLSFDNSADTYDKYGRALGYLSTEADADVAEQMVTYGLAEAWVPDSEPRPNRLDHYEQLAQSAAADQRGLYGRC